MDEPKANRPDAPARPGGLVGRLIAGLESRASLSQVGEDLATAYAKDPALTPSNAAEVLLYQGVWALAAYRLAHRLHEGRVPFLPRLISQLSRAVTGIEIHPGARIGRRCFIDHGAAVVIGETSVIGDEVMLYHQVTLGGHGWWADAKGEKRHPTIEDHVTLGVGATVLGPVTIGEGSKIGPHALIIDDIPAGSIVVAERGRCVTPGRPPGRSRRGEPMPTSWMTDSHEHEGGSGI